MSHLISSKIDTFECLHNERGRFNVMVVNVGVTQVQHSSSSIGASPKTKRNNIILVFNLPMEGARGHLDL